MSNASHTAEDEAREKERALAENKQQLINNVCQSFILTVRKDLESAPQEGEEAFIHAAGVGQGSLLLAADMAVRTRLPKEAFVDGASKFYDEMTQALQK